MLEGFLIYITGIIVIFFGGRLFGLTNIQTMGLICIVAGCLLAMLGFRIHNKE